MTIGHCKHGEFELEKGCEKCIAEKLMVRAGEKIGAGELIALNNEGEAMKVNRQEQKEVKKMTITNTFDFDAEEEYSKAMERMRAEEEEKMTIGHCKHGVEKGCPQCIQEANQEKLLDKIAGLPLVTEIALSETSLDLRRPGEDIEAPTITEQINAVVEAREKARELKSKRDTLLEEWNKANQVLFDTLTQAGAEVAEAESKLRELALEVYAENREKTVAPGVGIRVVTKLSYDALVALSWAMEHKIALSLDRKSFEKVVQVSSLDFVTITEEPTATIASTLEKISE